MGAGVFKCNVPIAEHIGEQSGGVPVGANLIGSAFSARPILPLEINGLLVVVAVVPMNAAD